MQSGILAQRPDEREESRKEAPCEGDEVRLGVCVDAGMGGVELLDGGVGQGGVGSAEGEARAEGGVFFGVVLGWGGRDEVAEFGGEGEDFETSILWCRFLAAVGFGCGGLRGGGVFAQLAEAGEVLLGEVLVEGWWGWEGRGDFVLLLLLLLLLFWLLFGHGCLVRSGDRAEVCSCRAESTLQLFERKVG